MGTLLDKLNKAGKVKTASILKDSIYFTTNETCKTDLPILNIAFSGDLDGGLTPGVTVLAGASKSFKSMLALYSMKAYLDKYSDAVGLFYDSEFGTPSDYLASIGIDVERVVHIPVTNIEELKFDLVSRLESVERGDHVFMMVDSIGNLASKKEYENAMAENSSKDMTRAQEIKSLFRITTPHITMKNLPCLIIAHTYKEMGCLKYTTKVVTESGIKQICDIVVGEKVLTPNGYKEVLDVVDPKRIPSEDKTYYEIECEDGTLIHCTGNHKFLCNGEWIRADQLNIGDSLTTLQNNNENLQVNAETA